MIRNITTLTREEKIVENDKVRDSINALACTILDSWLANEPREAHLVNFSPSAERVHKLHAKGSPNRPFEIGTKITTLNLGQNPREVQPPAQAIVFPPRGMMEIYDMESPKTIDISVTQALAMVMNKALHKAYVNSDSYNGDLSTLPRIAFLSRPSSKEFVIQFPVCRSGDSCRQELAEKAPEIKAHINRYFAQHFGKQIMTDAIHVMIQDDISPG